MDLSIFIFCYERPKSLLRQLNIFNYLNYTSDSNVYILDGSKSDKNIEKIKNIALKFNIKYYNEVSIQKRIKFVKQLLKTDYYCFCSDDDVINPNYFNKALEFLKINKNYSAASGRTIAFQYKKKFTYLGYRFVNHLPNNYDIFSDDFIERIKSLENYYNIGSPPIYYAVKRKECYDLIEKNIDKVRYSNFIEQLDKISTLLIGGVKVIDTFMGLRDYSIGAIDFETRDAAPNMGLKEDLDIIKKMIFEFFISKKGEKYAKHASNYAHISQGNIILANKTNKDILSLKKNFLKVVVDVFFNYYLNINFFDIDKKFTYALRKFQKNLI